MIEITSSTQIPSPAITEKTNSVSSDGQRSSLRGASVPRVSMVALIARILVVCE